MYALVDCNNFYVSCERVFNPMLENTGVVVLSNNDGCIIARSDEAKAIGIPMGAPMYKYREKLSLNNVKIYSSNYTLYGDMSARVMKSLYHFTPEVEVYSIDEAFLGLNGFNDKELITRMKEMKLAIKQWTGIPVSVGIARTKTLAKLANRIAKKYIKCGVYELNEISTITRVLSDVAVEDIWGISKRWGSRLRSVGVDTALKLRNSNPKMIRKCLSVVGERIVYELNGISCLNLEEVKQKKSIVVSRSFGTTIGNLDLINQALVNHVVRAAEKNRKQDTFAQGLQVFINTNRFKKQDRQYSNCITIGFKRPTQDTVEMIKTANRCLFRIYRSGYKYHKVGVILVGLVPGVQSFSKKGSNFICVEPSQKDLFIDHKKQKVSQKKIRNCMLTIDSINHLMGSGTIFYASQGVKNNYNRSTLKQWKMRSHFKSPAYTTRWSQLVKVS